MNRNYHKECESVREYVLPDYMGDVKKILSVNARVVPSGKFIDDRVADFSGSVVYQVLYSDSEGTLTSVDTSSDWDASLNLADSKYVDSGADFRVESVSLRLLGPRKMVLKSQLAIDASVTYEDSVSVMGDAFESGEEPQLSKREINIERRTYLSPKSAEYSMEAETLSGSSADDIEIIATSGSVRIIDATPSADGVLVKGEFIITSIVRVDDEPPFAIRKIVPFEELVSAEEVPPTANLNTSVYISSVSSSVTDADDGAVLSVAVSGELVCSLLENTAQSVVCDAYLVDYETTEKYGEYKYTELLFFDSSECDISCEVGREESLSVGAREILKSSCEIKSLVGEFCDGGVKIRGEAHFCGVACEINEENMTEYYPIKAVHPFEISAVCESFSGDGITLDFTLAPLDTTATLTPESIVFTVRVNRSIRVIKDSSVSVLTECNVKGEKEERCASSVVVYYPDSDDTLFSVAKRFRSTGTRIALDNELSEATLSSYNEKDSLLGIKRLIIK